MTDLALLIGLVVFREVLIKLFESLFNFSFDCVHPPDVRTDGAVKIDFLADAFKFETVNAKKKVQALLHNRKPAGDAAVLALAVKFAVNTEGHGLGPSEKDALAHHNRFILDFRRIV